MHTLEELRSWIAYCQMRLKCVVLQPANQDPDLPEGTMCMELYTHGGALHIPIITLSVSMFSRNTDTSGMESPAGCAAGPRSSIA